MLVFLAQHVVERLRRLRRRLWQTKRARWLRARAGGHAEHGVLHAAALRLGQVGGFARALRFLARRRCLATAAAATARQRDELWHCEEREA